MSNAEKLLAALIRGETVDIVPQSRLETILLDCINGVVNNEPKPQSRIEAYLYALSDKLVSGGGGGGGDLDAFISGETTELESNATEIKASAFASSNMTSIKLPKAKKIGSNAFDGCSKLQVLEIPVVEELGNYIFRSVPTSTIYKMVFPHLRAIGQACFFSCYSTIVDIGKQFCQSNGYLIGNQSFYFSKIKALIFRAETYIPLSYAVSSSFSSSNIASGTGYIYVRRALVDSYRSGTNWSAISSQIRALEDYTIDGTADGEFDESKI